MDLREPIRAREGDFIESVDGLIFDVKGIIHPPDKIIAYVRYVESSIGDRVKGSKRYIKLYSLSHRNSFLKNRYPQYIYYDHVFGDWLEGVPKSLVAKHYQPVQKTLELFKGSCSDEVERSTMRFIQEIHDFLGIPIKSIGVSGSVLVGLHNSNSDIDIIIYGRENCISTYDGLKSLLSERKRGFSPYDQKDLVRLYSFRLKDTLMPLDKFCTIESRKAFQGKFCGRDFFVRFVLEWDEVDEKYGDRLYRDAGYTRIKAIVEDNSGSIFTPCTYRISNVKVLEGICDERLLREIVSFRGRFCDHARRGEAIIAQGKIERIIEKDGGEYYHMVLGNNPSDFMIME
ncbi:MAG: nucleotidyltransferase domain-containing protein [Candidatus Bathyarchaeia archaeon]